MAKVSLEKDKIKFLLVEGVHQKALESLRAAGYTNIEFHKGALDDEQLKEICKKYEIKHIFSWILSDEC